MPIDQNDNNIGYLALHYLLSEFMSLPLKHSNTGVNYLECVDFIRACVRSYAWLRIEIAPIKHRMYT